MDKKQLGILFLLVSVLFWGPGPVITKLALTEVPWMSLAFFRGLISVLIAFLLFYRKGYFKIQRKDLPTFIIAGFLGAVFNLGFFFTGIQRTSAINAQTIFTINPVIVAILAAVLLKEKIKPVQFLGVLIGLAGALIIALREAFETGVFNNGSTFGNFLILLAALSWVGYILVSRNLCSRYSSITIAVYSFLVSFLVFIPLAVFENLQSSAWINSLTFKGYFGIFYQGVFASVLAFLAYQAGLKLTSAFAAGVVVYLNPLITILVAVPVLGEKITPLFLVGALLIVAGSLIATQFDLIKNHIHKRKEIC